MTMSLTDDTVPLRLSFFGVFFYAYAVVFHQFLIGADALANGVAYGHYLVFLYIHHGIFLYKSGPVLKAIK